MGIASLDAASAFDTVDHGLLLEKLEKLCGVQGMALQLLEDYHKERHQLVRMSGDRCSRAEKIGPWGVPQGSVLAPLLYTIYTADLQAHITKAEVVMYADDVTLIASGDTVDDMRKNMTEALSEFHAYATANRVLPEPEKTQYMELSNTWKMQEVGNIACTIAGTVLQPREAIKILGVIVDQKLSWDPHNAAAAAKARGSAWRVWRGCRRMSRG